LTWLLLRQYQSCWCTSGYCRKSSILSTDVLYWSVPRNISLNVYHRYQLERGIEFSRIWGGGGGGKKEITIKF
jgi:hypothetical protein